MLGKTYALAGRIVKPKTIPAVGVGVEKQMENWVSHAYFAGLFHSTTKTNQVLEINSVVDIGFHYLAVTNGVVFDTDADGIPTRSSVQLIRRYAPNGDGNRTPMAGGIAIWQPDRKSESPMEK